MYTYEVDGVKVETAETNAVSDGLLYASLGIAAVISFQRGRPVVIRLQGHPYRVVSVDFVNSSTRPPPRGAI